MTITYCLVFLRKAGGRSNRVTVLEKKVEDMGSYEACSPAISVNSVSTLHLEDDYCSYL